MIRASLQSIGLSALFALGQSLSRSTFCMRVFCLFTISVQDRDRRTAKTHSTRALRRRRRVLFLSLSLLLGRPYTSTPGRSMSHAERCPGRGIQKGEEKRDTPSRRPDFRLPEIVPAPESGGRPWPETCTAAHSLSIGKIIPPLHEETGAPAKVLAFSLQVAFRVGRGGRQSHVAFRTMWGRVRKVRRLYKLRPRGFFFF